VLRWIQFFQTILLSQFCLLSLSLFPLLLGSGFFQANSFFPDCPVAPVPPATVPPAGGGIFQTDPVFPNHPDAQVSAAGRGIFAGVAPNVAQGAMVPSPPASMVSAPAAIVPVHADGMAPTAQGSSHGNTLEEHHIKKSIF